MRLVRANSQERLWYNSSDPDIIILGCATTFLNHEFSILVLSHWDCCSCYLHTMRAIRGTCMLLFCNTLYYKWDHGVKLSMINTISILVIWHATAWSHQNIQYLILVWAANYHILWCIFKGVILIPNFHQHALCEKSLVSWSLYWFATHSQLHAWQMCCNALSVRAWEHSYMQWNLPRSWSVPHFMLWNLVLEFQELNWSFSVICTGSKAPICWLLHGLLHRDSRAWNIDRSFLVYFITHMEFVIHGRWSSTSNFTVNNQHLYKQATPTAPVSWKWVFSFGHKKHYSLFVQQYYTYAISYFYGVK